MEMVEVDTKVLEGMVDFVEHAVGYAQKQAETEAAVAERGPLVVDTLIKSGFINQENREAALKATRDPVKVLESLQKTASAKSQRQASEAPATLGSGEDIRNNGDTQKSGSESTAMKAVNDRLLRSLGF